jgi:hypothetical protein
MIAIPTTLTDVMVTHGEISTSFSPTCLQTKYQNGILDDDAINRASPVSVTSVFDNEQALQTIPIIPYPEDDSDFDQLHTCTSLLASHKTKKVRFLLDDDGNIDEGLSLYSFPTYKLTPKLIQECWYHKEDRLRSKFLIQKQCREFETSPSEHMEYRDAMVTAITFLVECDDEHEDPTHLTGDVLEAIAVIARGETRGTERSMQFHMSLPRISTKTNVHAVLRTQALLRELDATKYDANEVEELIADQCVVNSQLGIRWAKIMAQGDAIDVCQSIKSV